jgi:O-antigen/teichoic acid export membrane protein
MAETPATLDYSAESSTGQTGRAVVLITGGRVALQGVWFLATLLMARVLGPAAFATYTLATKAIQIVTDCFADPLDMAVMREAPLFLRTDRPAALELIRSAFWLRAGLGGVSVAFAAALPWAASAMIFGAPDHHRLAVATAVGILGDLLLRSVLGYFQVSERFRSFMVVDAIWQLGRAGAVGVFFFLRILNAATAVELYASLPYIAFGAALLVLPNDVLLPRFPSGAKTVQIFHYGKWIAAATTMTAVYERLDVFLLTWLRGRAEVGPYAGALALAMVPDFLNSCIQTVLGPKVAPAAVAGKFRLLQRQYLSVAIPLGAVAAAGALVLGGPVIRFVLSAKFVGSVELFKILVVSTLFSVVFTPLPTALVSFVAPRKMTVITGVGLVLVAGGGLLLIPRFGAMGAAVVILVVRVIVGIAVVVQANAIVNVGQRPVVQ